MFSIKHIGTFKHRFLYNAMKEDYIFSLVTQQTEYIDQLEKNNLFLKYELQNFQSKLKVVIEENESFYNDERRKVARSILAESKNNIAYFKPETQGSPISSLVNKTEVKPTKDKIIPTSLESWKAELKIIRNLYQTKINKLKEELLSTNNELNLTKSLLNQKTKILNNKHNNKNAQDFDKENAGIMNDLLSERSSLLETIKGLNDAVSKGREQEVVLRQDLQNSMKSTEELQLQVSHLQLCKANLESDLCDLNKKNEANLSNTKQLVEDAVKEQKKSSLSEMDKMIKDKTILEKENLKNVTALKRFESENFELQSSVAELYKEIYSKEKVIAGYKSMNQMNNYLKEKESSNKELCLISVKSNLERNLQNEKNEKMVVNQKLKKVGTKLELSKQKELELQNLNINLNERIYRMQNELSKVSSENEKELRESKEQVITLKQMVKQLKNQNFNNINLLEESYKCRLIELERLSNKQAGLIKKLKNECCKLEADISSVSEKYEIGMKMIQKNNTELILRVKILSQKNKELSDQCVKHGILHKNMSKYIESIL